VKEWIFTLVCIAFTGLLFGLTGFWWGIWMGGFITGSLIMQSWKNGLSASFCGGFLFWLIYSLILYGNGSELIAQKIAELLHLSSGMMLIMVSSFLGGVLALLGFCVGKSQMQIMKSFGEKK